jgi:hypothetical protein
MQTSSVKQLGYIHKNITCVDLESVDMRFLCTIYANVLQYQTRIVWDVTRASLNIGTFRRNRFIPHDKGRWFLGKLALDYKSAVHCEKEDNQRRALKMADLLKL